MSDNVNINVTENIDQVNIVASEIVEVVDLNLYATTEDVSINVTEEIIQVNINKVQSSNITKTSDLINDGEDGVNPFITLEDIPNPPTPTLESVLAESNITNGNDISISDGDEITFDNNSRIRKGLTDSGNGGAKGVALVCSLDYELKWEAGRQYVMQQDGFTIREVSHNFTITPTATDDDTKGFVIGSRWILDNGDVYVCTDATEDSAVWELQVTDVQDLQNVTDIGNVTTNNIYIPKLYLYDEPNDNYGSVHYTDGNFHIEDGDGHPLFVVEDGFLQLHLTDTIQSNLFLRNLTETRDHYLPDESGIIALRTDIPEPITIDATPTDGSLNAVSSNGVFDALATKENSLGFTPENVANKSTNILLGPSDTLYPSQRAVKSYADSKVENAIVSGVTTVAPSQNAVFDALALKQNDLGFIPYRFFNSTQSIGSNPSGETQLIRVTIPANSFSSSDKFYFRLGFNKVGTANTTTIRAKLTTSSTMPAGAASMIAASTMAATTLYSPVERTMAINGGNLKGFPFTNSNVSDNGSTTTAWGSVAFDVTQTQYFYVSIAQAVTTTDVIYLEFIEISNI